MARHSPELALDTIERALADIAAGKPVIVVDDPSRENEGDFIMAAEDATPEWAAFFMRYTTGVICAPMAGEICDRLELPPMYHINEDRNLTAFTVSVDARESVTTGVSATDRARTLRLLADPATMPSMLTRPGHMFPLRAREGGVLVRGGHTEASVDLMRLAGKQLVAMIAEIVNPDGSMSRLPELALLAQEHKLAIVTIADLVAYRRRHEAQVEEIASAKLPTEFGMFRASVWRDVITGREHVALVAGELAGPEPVLVRAHSECLTGDTLRSMRCDCGAQLTAALTMIAKEGRGVLVYVGGHEGRGIGIADKIRAYALQDQGADTVDANLELGLPVDAREYYMVGQILSRLGVAKVRLLTNNPIKQHGLSAYVEVVAREPLEIEPNEYNIGYLRTKQLRLHHDLHILKEVSNSKRLKPAKKERAS